MVFAKIGIGSSGCLKLGRVLCCGVFFILPALVMSRTAQADTSLKFEKSAVYGDGLDQTGNAIESRDGRLYIAGGESAANMKALSVGYEAPPAGDPIFNFRWQSDPSVPTEETFTDVAAAPEGLYFAGQSRSSRTKQSWPFLVKFSNTGGQPSGAPAWLARPQLFDRYQEGVFYATLPVQEQTGAAIYATGYASSRQSNRTAVLAKYDPNGKLLWFKKLSDEDERGRGAGLGLAEHNGSIYVGGYTDNGERKSDVDSIPLYTTLWKYDSSGKEIWRKKDEDSRLYVIKGELQDVKVDLAASEDFLYLTAAEKKDEEAGVLLLKYDSDGEQLWSAEWNAKAYSGAARAGFPSGIIADKDRLYVAGWTTSSSKKGATPNEDAFLLEVDKEYGFVIAVHEHGEPARQERALGVETDGADVYVAGLQRSAASKGKSAQNDLTLLQYKIQPIMNVKIEIQPQTKKPAKKEKGNNYEEEQRENESKIAVTILSDSKFNPTTDVRTKSLTFGRSGHERSWDSCGIKDVNSDGTLDLVCYFEPQFKFQKERQDIFQEGDTYGILRGDTASGTPLVGKARLRADNPDPDPVKEEEEEAAAPPAPAPEILISAPVTSPEAPVEPPQVETSPAITTQDPVSVPTTSVEAPPQVETSTTTTEPETSTVTTTPQILISAPVTSPVAPVEPPQVETSTTTAEPETATVTTTQDPVSAPTILTEEPLRSPQVETSTATAETETATAPITQEPVNEPTTSIEEPIRSPQIETSTATAEPETTTVTTTQDPVSAPTTLTEEPVQSPQVETSTATTEIKTSTVTVTQDPVSAPVTSTAVSTAQFETAPTTTLKDPITTTSLPTVTATVTNTTETAPKNITTLQTPTLISTPYRTTTVSTPVSTTPVPATTPPAAPVPAVVPAAGMPAHIENIPAPVQTPLRVLGSGPGTGKVTSTARVSPSPDASGGVLRSLESPAYQAPKSSPEKTDPVIFSSSGPGSGSGSSSAKSEADSGLAQAYNDMGREVFESGKAQEAIIYFEEALKLNPKSVEAHTYAGRALVKAGRLGEAKKHLLKAAQLKPNDEAIKKQLQEVLEQLGEEEDLPAPDESGNESDQESADK